MLSREDIRIVEDFMEPYKDLLEDVLTSSDVESEAQRQAWKDWAVEKLMNELCLTDNLARIWVDKLECYYKKKTDD